MRRRFVAIIAIIGMSVTTLSALFLGIGAYAAANDNIVALIAEPTMPTSARAAPPAEPRAEPAPDTYEEMLEYPPSELMTDPGAVPDTDAERAVYAGYFDECMAGKGFEDFSHAAAVAAANTMGGHGWSEAYPEGPEREAFDFAAWGDTGTLDDYHWEDAGCAGYATHVTGNDGNH